MGKFINGQVLANGQVYSWASSLMGKFLLMGKFIHGQVLAHGHVLAHGSGPGPRTLGPRGGVGWGGARPQQGLEPRPGGMSKNVPIS